MHAFSSVLLPKVCVDSSDFFIAYFTEMLTQALLDFSNWTSDKRRVLFYYIIIESVNVLFLESHNKKTVDKVSCYDKLMCGWVFWLLDKSLSK